MTEREPPPPITPTIAPPGSPAKVEVLAQRVAQGYALWHEDDGTIPAPRKGTREYRGAYDPLRRWVRRRLARRPATSLPRPGE